MKSFEEWLGIAIFVDMIWICVLFGLRKKKTFVTAWLFGVFVASAGTLFCGYSLISVFIFSQTPGEVALGGLSASVRFFLSLPFVLLLLLYVRAYRRYRDENSRSKS